MLITVNKIYNSNKEGKIMAIHSFRIDKINIYFIKNKQTDVRLIFLSQPTIQFVHKSCQLSQYDQTCTIVQSISHYSYCKNLILTGFLISNLVLLGSVVKTAARSDSYLYSNFPVIFHLTQTFQYPKSLPRAKHLKK